MPLLNSQQIKKVYQILSEVYPEPKSELQAKNHFTFLVAVVLSAQATDVGVNKATGQLFKKADTPQKMLELGEESLKEYIKTINFYPTKAKRIIALSEILLAEHGGEVPDSREALESLPGVGRKTANVVLNACFGVPTIAVDTHVFRTATRVGLSNGKTALEVEQDLLKITPKKYLAYAHHLILLHGRYVCKARKPECDGCLLKSICLKKNL